MSDTSRRDVLTGAACLAAGSVLALPAPAVARTEPVDVPFRIEPLPTDLHEIGLRLFPSRMIIDIDLVQRAIDALDDYQRFDSPEERLLITELQKALHGRPRRPGLRDGPGTEHIL